MMIFLLKVTFLTSRIELILHCNKFQSLYRRERYIYNRELFAITILANGVAILEHPSV